MVQMTQGPQLGGPEPTIKLSPFQRVSLIRILATDKALKAQLDLLNERLARAMKLYGAQVADWPAVEVDSLMALRNDLQDKLMTRLAREGRE